MSKADKDGWIRHRGGKRPVRAMERVDIRYRDGGVEMVVAGEMRWTHGFGGGDIMAYRLHKPAEQPDQEADAKAAAQAAINPLEWRDRITEIDRTIEALEEERVSLIQRLADEGLQLLQGKVCGEVQPVEDMSDPANWRKGDLITFVGGLSDPCFTSGKQYVFDDLSGYGSANILEDDEGDYNGWCVEYFKWHSRPSA